MTENTKKTPIVLDDVEYTYEQMTPKAQSLVNHVADLDRKISSAQFNLNQLVVGKQAFIGMLKEELTKVEEIEVASEVVQ
jgi:hypothetical protein